MSCCLQCESTRVEKQCWRPKRRAGRNRSARRSAPGRTSMCNAIQVTAWILEVWTVGVDCTVGRVRSVGIIDRVEGKPAPKRIDASHSPSAGHGREHPLLNLGCGYIVNGINRPIQGDVKGSRP